MFRRRRPPSADPLSPLMVAIPAGPFRMGTSPREARDLERTGQGRPEWYKFEQPAHLTQTSAYSIGKFPVTVGEFRHFIMAGGYANEGLWDPPGWLWRIRDRINAPEYWRSKRWTARDDFPIVGVSWYEARAYCAWLRHETGLAYRLPEEAEWEKAARGTEGLRFPWGNRWDASRCNAAKQSVKTWNEVSPAARKTGLVAVGHYSAKSDSPFGCSGMAGNVWEWCQSPLRGYPLPDQQQVRLAASEPQIVRGGSWYHGPEDARCAARFTYFPQCRDNIVGFRLAYS